MVRRQGSRGPFLGCNDYPRCRGSRSLGNAGAAAGPRPSPSVPKVETATPSGAFISDLRRAAGHLGAAVDLLRRRGPELDKLLATRELHLGDDPSVPF